MIKSFLIYLPSILFPRLAAFLTILVGTRLLMTEAFGYFSLVAVVGEFADIALTNWTRIAFTRFGATKDGVSRAFALKMAAIAAGCTAFAVLAAAAAASALAPEQGTRVALAVAAYIGAAAAVRFGVVLNQASRKASRASALESARAILAFGASVTAMANFGDFLPAILAGAGANLAVGVLALASGFGMTRPALADRVDWPAVRVFAMRMLLLSLLAQAIYSLDKLLLKTFQDAATLGVYVAAFAVARNGFDIIANSFNIGGFVSLSLLQHEGRAAEARTLLRRQLGFILAVALPAAAVLLSARDTIALALFPRAYFDSFQIAVPFVTLGAIMLNLKNFVYDNIFHLHLRNLLQAPPLIAGALAGSATGLLLMPVWPVLGAALTFAIGAATVLAVTVALSTPLMPVAVPWRAIGAAATAGLAAFGASELIKLLMSGAPAYAVLLVHVPLAVAAIAVSLALANSAMGTRNANLAVSFVTSDPERVTGLSSYADSLIDALARDPAWGRLVALTNAAPAVLPRARGHDKIRWVELPKKPRLLPYKAYSPLVHALGGFFALRKGCGAYLSTTAAGSVLPFVEQFVTIHDLYDLDRGSHPLRTVAYAHVMWRWFALVSRRIVCVSDTTRAEAAAAMPFAKARMVTIKEASKFAPEPARAPDEPPHFLYVANVQPTKNVECLLSALKRAEAEGEALAVRWIGRDPVGIVAAFAEREGLPTGFVAVGTASEGELKEGYRRASALIVSSWNEGFCLPVLEAHALTTPVIASDIAVLREVAGEGALFFDPHRPEDLLATMRALQHNPDLRESLSAAASANAALYSWEKAARETLTLTTSLFEARPKPA